MTARPVLQQRLGSDGVLSKLEYTHETVAHHAVLFLAGAAARDWRRVILRERDSYRTGDPSRRHARQSVVERNLCQFGHIGVSLEPVNVAPGDFPIAISFFQLFCRSDQCFELSREIIEEFWSQVFLGGISGTNQLFIPFDAKGRLGRRLAAAAIPV